MKVKNQKSSLALLRRIGYFSVRYRWGVLVASLVFLVVAVIGSMGVTNRLDSGGFDVPGSESFRANAILAQAFHTGDANLVLLVTTKHGTVDAQAVVREGTSLTKELAAQAGVTEVTSYWTRGLAPTLRSRDDTQALVLAHVGGTTTQARDRIGHLLPVFTRSDAVLRVGVTGDDAILQQSGTQSQRDLVRAELITLPILLLLLLFVFRSPVAALLPLAMSGIVIFGTLLVLRIIVSFTPISNFALNLTTALSLGIGVDYSLFIVSRFREELHGGKAVQEAVVSSIERAGRIVAFSALTFGVALTGLLISPNFFLPSFAYAGIAVVVVGLACALLTLPAALAVLGSRVDLWSIGRRQTRVVSEGPWHRFALFVMRRAVPISLVGIALLVALGLPFLRVQVGLVDERILPSSASTRQVQEVIRSHFVGDESHALHVVVAGVTAATSQEAIQSYALALSGIPGVVEVDAATGSYAHGQRIAPPQAGSTRFAGENSTWFSVIPSQEQVMNNPFGLVHAVRSLPAPFPVEVGGHLAAFSDLQNSIVGQIPIVIVIVVLATMVILFLMTGSIVLPLKATILNFLSLCATFGVLVWTFQDGHLAHLLSFTPSGTLEIRTTLMTFCLAFGLSMDYEVFILGRIKEEYDRTGDTPLAVASGLERSGPLVTAAALLLAVVFLGFSTSEIVLFKLLGAGMTLAVLLDVSIIRTLLVPSFMLLMGRFNWWAPAVLQRLQQRIGLSEAEPVADVAQEPAAFRS